MKKGFTLIEVLVAVTILVLVIEGVTLIESRNIRYSSSTKYRTQANSIASEGLNLVKSISDTKQLSGGSTCDGAADCCDDPTDRDQCEPGVYFFNLRDNNKLIRCGDDLDSCTVPPESITKIDGKDFTRKVVIPDIALTP